MPEDVLPDADDGVPERIPLPTEAAELTRAREFRRRFFADATDREWNDWRWQLRNRIRDLEKLERITTLTESERSVIEQIGGRLPVGITPYYAAQMDLSDPNDPIRVTLVPQGAELLKGDRKSVV